MQRFIQLNRPKAEKKLISAYRKFSGKPDIDKLLSEKFNKTGDTLLYIKEGTWFQGDDPQMDNIQWIKGTVNKRIDNLPSIIVIMKVIEPLPLPFKEVQSEMMTGFQDFLETEWLRQLKGKYSVKIDSSVLEDVKKRLTDE